MTMLSLDPARTALVAIDMHRGHFDPAVATLPWPPNDAIR
jgi:biuret amidohydrolase